MRILSISLLVFASSASAQSLPSVDCDAVKNSMIPVELAYHSQNGTRTVVQAYRDKSGDYVVWSRQTPPSTHPNPPVFVTKATYVDGAIASAELSTTYAGKYSHRTAKYTPDGLPRNFDRRSDVTYKMHALITPGDDTTEEKTSTISYKFKSEETAAVGSWCPPSDPWRDRRHQRCRPHKSYLSNILPGTTDIRHGSRCRAHRG